MKCTRYAFFVHNAKDGAIVCIFFNDTATTEIYTLSLHDALPIWRAMARAARSRSRSAGLAAAPIFFNLVSMAALRSEEHTSELQSRQYLVCRLLLEKKKKSIPNYQRSHLLVPP